jgi:single-stranded-DNA-specific exonuclease
MRWTLKPRPDSQITADLANALGVDQAIARLLVNRGIDNFEKARSFFRPDLGELHDPFLMKDMDRAVDRLELALERGEGILVYGDYDVDGTTAVSLLATYLRTIHEQVATYIPDRYEEGYGVSKKGIDFADDNGLTLIIALDCGIKATDKVAYAAEKGIDFIICDHHNPGPELPAGLAVLDPKREDCDYPYKDLCGCGVGFKLVQALGSRRGQDMDELVDYLDLVAIAIGADIVPITGENRVLAHFGLQVLNSGARIGIAAMTERVDKDTLSMSDVVFRLAPQINAAGRLHHGDYAVDLLTQTDPDQARERAILLQQNNEERKQIDRKITDEAFRQIEELNEQQAYATVVFAEDWHKGVIGIVASRLIETYYRPTVVVTRSGDKLAASVRSVKGYDVYKALEQCADHLEQFGGHKYAAGLTMYEDQYPAFKEKFNAVVRETLPEDLRSPEILIDDEVDLTDLTPKFYRILKQFAPFGPRNMKPVFASYGLRDNGYGRQVGADRSHLKLSLFQGGGTQTFDAIGFGLGNRIGDTEKGKCFQAVFSLDENTWNGRTSLQLLLKDIRPETE